MPEKRIILMLGPPGSGKTTCASNVNILFSKYFSIGAKYRELCLQDSLIGKEINDALRNGEVIPIDIARQVISDFIEANDGILIIDGFPINIEQAKMLDNYLRDKKCKITNVIEISVDEEIALSRILFRNRGADDKKELFCKRMELFNRDLEMIRSYYAGKVKYSFLNGNVDLDKILNQIREIISEII